MAILVGFILFLKNSLIFWALSIFIAFYTLIILIFNKSIKNINKKILEKNSELTSLFLNGINGIEAIKAYNMENIIEEDIENDFFKLLKLNLDNGKIQNYLLFFTNFISNIGNLIIVWMNSYYVIIGNLTLGDFLVLNSLIVYFINLVKNLISLLPTLQKAILAAERLSDILEIEIENNEENKIENFNLTGDIEIKNLSFSYGTREQVLENISVNIKSGDTIGIVGSVGCGKSTFIKLLLRFYEYEKGSIYIGNYNIQDLNLINYREKIGYVSQELFIFNKSIIDNLMVNSKVNIEKIIELSKIVGIYDFIESLPYRFNTIIEKMEKIFPKVKDKN